MAKTLTVFLAADLKKFNAGMRDAQGQVQGFGGTLKNNLGPALAAAAAAAGAFAVKLGVDGVKAAMEDQAAVAALTTTLENLNLAHDTTAVEAYIGELERAYGVADDELRPAYDRLIRSTRDIEDANNALRLAMDISAGTGKNLTTVTEALGKAYDGNTTALGRLGLGIDRAQLSSMSLDDILQQLSGTFAGQADASARTFEGQMKRVQTATDNLKEAFGRGLLNALGDTESGTQGLVDAMEDLEPVIEVVGDKIGDFAADTAYLAGLVATLGREAQETAEDMGPLNTILGLLNDTMLKSPLATFVQGIRALRGETEQGFVLEVPELPDDWDAQVRAYQNAQRDAAGATSMLRNAAEGATNAFAAYVPMTATANRYADELTETTDDLTRNLNGAATQTDKLTKKQEKLIKAAELQGVAFAAGRDALLEQIRTVEEATKAVEDYASKIQQDLLAGIDLGGLAEGAMNEEGKLSADKFFQGFDAAINQAEWFGNVLTALKARGIDQNLLEQIASLGPATGGALGQELLDGDGALLQTLNEKWVGVQDKTRELALGLVPEFLEAGRLSAIDTLNGLATQFGEDQRKFKRLGKRLGEQVGSEFKAQIARDVAEAVRAVEAAATAARAEAVAREETRQAAITEQAVASAIANLIRNSDQRTGRNVRPVLS